MAASVGIRVYLVTVQKRGEVKKVSFTSRALATTPVDFVSYFIATKNTPSQNDVLERSWYLEEKSAPFPGTFKGYVHYGTYGFESNFVDNKTKKKNYRRKKDDVEEIPLYFEFWFPAGKDYGFAVFQSFQGRSCIQILMASMRQEYESQNSGHMLVFRKLTPSDKDGGVFNQAPVKRLRLIRKNVSSDVAERYLGSNQAESVNFEVAITAGSRRNLGPLGSLKTSIKDQNGLVIHEGVEFREAIAEIRVGNGIRRVGVFGGDGDTGVIDLTDTVKKGLDGHPDFASLAGEVDSILKDFNQTIASASL